MREFHFSNTTGGTIPAGAAMVPTGVDASGFLTVAQPTVDSSMFVVFNGPVDVATGAKGVAFGWDGGVVPVGVNSADEPYTAADTFGTAAGDWKLRKGKFGFRLPTPSIQGLANAVPDPMAGGPAVTRDIPTNVCAILDTYGALTGIRVEYTPVTFPTGTTFGVPYCVTNPTTCCAPKLTCEGCPGTVTIPTLTFSFTDKTGLAAAIPVPDDVDLEFVEAISLTSLSYRIAGSVDDVWLYAETGEIFVVRNYLYNLVSITCREGTPGFVVTFTLGPEYLNTPTAGNESDGPFWVFGDPPLVLTVELDCDAFDTSGAVEVGTITHTAPPSGAASEMTLVLSWTV